MWTDWIDQWEASADRISYDASARLTRELLATSGRLNMSSLAALRQTVDLQSQLAREQLDADDWPQASQRWAAAVQQLLSCTTALYRDVGEQWQGFCAHANEIIEEEQLHLGQGVGIPVVRPGIPGLNGRNPLTAGITFWLDVASKSIEQLPRFGPAEKS